jgi:hypothetical protein
VQDDETFSALLEEPLKANELKINGKTVQILNVGVPSYSPILSFLQLKNEFGSCVAVVLNVIMATC